MPSAKRPTHSVAMVAPKMGSAMLLVSLLALHSGASAQGMCEDNREYKAKTCDAGCPFGFPKCAVDTTTSFTSAVWGPDGSEFSVDPLTDRIRVAVCQPGNIMVRTADAPIDDDCWPCPEGYYSLEKPFFNSTSTIAKAATSATALAACTKCPVDATCPGGTVVYGKTGYWVDTDTTISSSITAVKCKAFACNNTDGTCPNNRMGDMCNTCAAGYGEEFGTCLECKTFAGRNLVGAIALVLILIVTWFPAMIPARATNPTGVRTWSRAWLFAEGAFKIVVVYFQVYDMYQFWVFPQLNNTLVPVDFFQAYFSLDVWSLLFSDRFWTCLMTRDLVGTVWDNQTRLLVWSLTPICFMLLQLVPVMIVSCTAGTRSIRFRNAASAAGTGVLFVIFISYPSVPRALIQYSLNCATLSNGTQVLLHDPSELCLVTSSFTFIYGLASTIFWALGAPLAVLFTMIAYGVPTLAADKVREAEVRAVIRHHSADGGVLPAAENAEDVGVLTQEQMRAVLTHQYTGLDAPWDQESKVMRLSEAGLVSELQNLSRALVAAGLIAIPALEWDSAEGALEDAALDVAGFAFRSASPRLWGFEILDMIFRFILGASLQIIMFASPLQYIVAIMAPLMTIVHMIAMPFWGDRRLQVLYAFGRVVLVGQAVFTLLVFSDGTRAPLGAVVFAFHCAVLALPILMFIHENMGMQSRYRPSKSQPLFLPPPAQVIQAPYEKDLYMSAQSVPPMQMQAASPGYIGGPAMTSQAVYPVLDETWNMGGYPPVGHAGGYSGEA